MKYLEYLENPRTVNIVICLFTKYDKMNHQLHLIRSDKAIFISLHVKSIRSRYTGPIMLSICKFGNSLFNQNPLKAILSINYSTHIHFPIPLAKLI